MFLFYLIFWFLGLQDRIEFSTGAYIQNIYDAEGTKLRQIIVAPSGGQGATTDYMGEVIYRQSDGSDDTLISIAHDEGYSVPLDDNNTAFMPRFFYNDHLGNTRLVYSVAPNGAYITQENHYGPYGEVLEGIGQSATESSDRWKFLYQGKEYVDGLGYDFHARNYDAWRGQFDGIDPVDYYGMGGTVAMYNNPISVTDPDGRCPNCITGLIGAAIGGTINLGVKLYQGKIGTGKDALMAFGIGAAAGFVTGFTGGLAAGAVGLSATSIVGGAVAGSAGAIAGAPIQGLGNMAYFGDPYSAERYATDIVVGGVMGGVAGGVANLIKGAKTGIPTNIWTDKPVLGGNSIWSLANKPITRIDIEPITGEFPAITHSNGKVTQTTFDAGGGSGVGLSIVHNEGGIMGGSFNYSKSGVVDFLANKNVVGQRLELTDMAFYPQGVKGNELKNAFGTRNMLETLDIFKNYAKSQGFTELRMQFQRAANSSSATPGHVFDKIFNLK